MEGDLVGVRIDTGRVVRAGFVQEDEVNHSYSSDDEREQEVECEESSEGGIVHGEAPSDSLNESAPNVWDCGKKVGDDSGTSERHLSSGEDVSNEGSHHNQKKENYPDVSCLFI